MKNPQRILILGATSGIGKALARIYAASGAHVAITGRRTGLLDALKHENPGYIARTLDVTKTDVLHSHLDALAGALGGIDLIILNAGAGNQNEALDFDVECRAIHPNVYGFTCACDWAVNYLCTQGYGQLAAVTSVAGVRGIRYAPAYSASKAYQITYLAGMRQKVGKLGLPIHITDIRPGFVDTAMAPAEAFWVAPVEKAARQMVRAIRKKKRVVYVTRRWMWLVMGMRMAPEWLFNRF